MNIYELLGSIMPALDEITSNKDIQQRRELAYDLKTKMGKVIIVFQNYKDDHYNRALVFNSMAENQAKLQARITELTSKLESVKKEEKQCF